MRYEFGGSVDYNGWMGGGEAERDFGRVSH